MLRMLLALSSILHFLVNLPSAVGQELPESVRIGTWNLEWFYDHDTSDNKSRLSREQSAPGEDAWKWKLDAVTQVIAKHRPYIMCFQEVENRDVIFELRNQLKSKHKLSYRVAFVKGFDSFTEQDVAIIFRNGLVEMSRREQNEEQWQSGEFYNLSKHLFARFEWGKGESRSELLLLNVHLRAMPEKEDLRIKQIKLIREWISAELKANRNVVVVGDLNTEHAFGSEKAHTDIGILRGLDDDDAENDLIDSHQFLKPDSRATHITGKQYDRILFSRSLLADSDSAVNLTFSRVFTGRNDVVRGERDELEKHWNDLYSIPEKVRDISDHYPVFSDFHFK